MPTKFGVNLNSRTFPTEQGRIWSKKTYAELQKTKEPTDAPFAWHDEPDIEVSRIDMKTDTALTYTARGCPLGTRFWRQ